MRNKGFNPPCYYQLKITFMINWTVLRFPMLILEGKNIMSHYLGNFG